jgi:leucyl aminopeptidase
MDIKILNKSILDFDGDLIIVNLFEGVKIPGGATGAVDRAIKGAISGLIEKGEIKGKLGETTVFHTLGRIKPAKVMVVGLGKSDAFGMEEIRKASGAAAAAARRSRARKVATIAHGAGIGSMDPAIASQAAAEGTLLALYEFTQYRKSDSSGIGEFYVLEMDPKKLNSIRKGAAKGAILAQSQNIARDFTNEPANSLTPVKLGDRVRKIISELGLTKELKVTVYGKNDIARLKMGALLSVAQGSDNEPRFIILTYRNAAKPLVCLIGKTVTFDSGGISIKASEGMEAMKGDMTGGGVVFSTIVALARTKAPVNVMALIPAVENMPSGKASRPGDVVRAMNGKTIEIISTDAEGRMTLADALCYAEKEKAKVIVDIATLTGGAGIAFGDVTAAVMGNDQKYIDMLLASANNAGERMWQMPLFEEYEQKIKSEIADMKNSGGRWGSPITAGIFLKAFVEKAPWVHIDIAGKEFAQKEKYYQPKGATGFGVRTLFEFCERLK